MAALLRYLGLLALALGTWLLIAEEASWLSNEDFYAFTRPILLGGCVAFLGGIVLAVLSPVARTMVGARCARCSASVPRGQTYCADHLRATVQEYRDRQHKQGY